MDINKLRRWKLQHKEAKESYKNYHCCICNTFVTWDENHSHGINISEIAKLIHEHENAHHKYVMSIDDKSYDKYVETTRRLLTIMIGRTPNQDEVYYVTDI